jgi:hypothetical protein
MTTIRRLLGELKHMRAQDQALMDMLNSNESEGVDLQVRREALRDLSLAARVDQGVIDQLEKLAEKETTAVERLGQVLSWTANIIAAIILVLAVLWMRAAGPNDTMVILTIGVVLALIAYGVGRGLRYIFSGY